MNYGLSTPMRHRVREAALFGRLPTLETEREYGTAGTLVASLHYAVAAWALLVGGYAAEVLGAVPGLLTLLAGNLCGVGLAAMAALGCNRYGVDLFDVSKACFGQRGAKLLLVFIVGSQIGWSGLMLLMFGRAVQNILMSLGLQGGDSVASLMMVIGWTAAYVTVARGTRGLTWATRLSTPSVAIIGCIVVYGVLRDASWQDLIRIPPLMPGPDTRVNHITAFECALGTGLSWWPTLARISRSADSQRASLQPQLLSMGAAAALLMGAGHLGALLFRNYDPTQWLVFLGGRAFGVLTLAVVTVANITACVVMMRACGQALRHWEPVRRWAWPKLLALPFVPMLATAWHPASWYERGALFLACNSTLLAPLCAVTLTDYYLLRRQRLNLSQLFEDAPHGQYWYVGGTNLAAWGCVLLGQMTSFWLYNPFTQTAHSAARWIGATGPAMLLCGGAYWCIGKLWLTKNQGGYGAGRAPLPLTRPNL